MIIKRLYKLKQASKLKQLYKITSLFAIALVLSVTSITALITPQANATTLPNVVADPGFNLGSGFDGLLYRNILVYQPDGKILVGGSFSTFNGATQNRLIRLNQDGSKDNSFDIGSGFDNDVSALLLLSDGKIVVGGRFTNFNGNSQNRIVRLNQDGSIDNSFNVGIGFSGGAIRSLAKDSNNNIYIGNGNSSVYNANISCSKTIFKVDNNGILDESFCSNINILGTMGTVDDLEIKNNILYVASWGNKRIYALNLDGIESNIFLPTSRFISGRSFCLHLQSDNKILIGGDQINGGFTTTDGKQYGPLIRLMPDGSVDESFTVSNVAINNTVSGVITQSDNKIIVSGGFTMFDGAPQNHIIRLNTDGSKDTSFNIGDGFDNYVSQAIIQPDDKLLLGGYFTTYQNQPHNRLIRLQITPDRDQDGLEDSIEDTVSNNGDANNDSILDSNQNNVSSFINPITNKTSSIQVDPSCTLSNITTKEESNQNNQDDTYSYPLGLYDFTASCGTPGYTTTVKLYNYDTPSTTSYITRKYNPNTKLYSDLIGSYLEDITINNQTVKVSNYSLTDGSDNDTDNQVNGIIVDPVGLATITTTTNTTPMAPNTGVGMNSSTNYITILITLLIVFGILGLIYRLGYQK